jgi:hypothetical protein
MNGQIKPKLNASYLFLPITDVHVLVASGGGIYHLSRSTIEILFCSTMYPTLEKKKSMVDASIGYVVAWSEGNYWHACKAASKTQARSAMGQ